MHFLSLAQHDACVFLLDWGSYQQSPDQLTGFRGAGREEKGEKEIKERRKGKGEKKGEEV